MEGIDMDKFEENYYINETETQEASKPIDAETELRKTIQRQKKTMFRLIEKINRLKIACAVLAVLLVIESFLWWGNSGSNDVPIEPQSEQSEHMSEPIVNIPEEDSASASNISEAELLKIEEILSAMTLNEKIYQMIFTTPENLTGMLSVTAAGDLSKESIEKHPVGGLLYSSKNIESADQVKSMLDNMQSFSKTPLFFAVSETGADGAVSSVAEVSSMDIDVDFNSAEDVAGAYSTIGSELKALGFNMNMAPFAEISDSDGCFSSDVQSASDMVKSAVNGLKKNKIASALKYFPTGSSDEKSIDELKNNNFISFASGINAGAEFVIVSSSENKDGEPYCMSSEYIRDHLKASLGFSGVSIAEDISVIDGYSVEKAAVYAVNAGADMLICSKRVSSAVTALTDAVENGELTEETINESVKKILKVKLMNNIIK